MNNDHYLKKVIEAIRHDTFGGDLSISDEQCLGVAIARYVQWDGRIVSTCAHALEEANFHTLAEPLFADMRRYPKAA